MMTDPIADMLTRMRNAIQARHASTDMPLSSVKQRIAEILKSEGFIEGFDVLRESAQGTLRVHLRYIGEDMESPVHGLRRISRPGCRVYAKHDEIPQVLGGFGIAIVSTSRGMMTGKAATKAQIGGELVCSVW